MPENKNTDKRKRIFTILFAVLAALTVASFAAFTGYISWTLRDVTEGIEAGPGVAIIILLMLCTLFLLPAEFVLWRSSIYFFCTDAHPWYKTVIYSFYVLVTANTFSICIGTYVGLFAMFFGTSIDRIYGSYTLLRISLPIYGVLRLADVCITRLLIPRKY